MNYYAVLNLSPTASYREIGKAYKREALTTHPDKKGDEEKMKLLNEAKETLVI